MTTEIPALIKHAKIIPSLWDLPSDKDKILLVQTQYKDYIVFAHGKRYCSSELICLFEKEKDATNFRLTWNKAIDLLIKEESQAFLKIWDITDSLRLEIII